MCFATIHLCRESFFSQNAPHLPASGLNEVEYSGMKLLWKDTKLKSLLLVISLILDRSTENYHENLSRK